MPIQSNEAVNKMTCLIFRKLEKYKYEIHINLV
jgi:hypothetical protein